MHVFVLKQRRTNFLDIFYTLGTKKYSECLRERIGTLVLDYIWIAKTIAYGLGEYSPSHIQ